MTDVSQHPKIQNNPKKTIVKSLLNQKKERIRHPMVTLTQEATEDVTWSWVLTDCSYIMGWSKLQDIKSLSMYLVKFGSS